ncbi:carbohydrate sulfotransferase 13-like [Amphiura filiformis]|uniref:carbohydrate sulfotransferase 13-like n=1 Tax=Amphiura filiformis TaxID=82378 RepID=UPI003B217913
MITTNILIFLHSDIDDGPFEDEFGWLQEQQRRRNTIKKACAQYNPDEHITQDVLRHILVSDTHKVLYCYIPKVACTNWKRIILLLNGKENVTNVHYTFIPSLKTFSTEEVIMRLRDYTKLMIVRNPHDRLLSAYIDKLDPTSNASDAKAFQHNFGPRIKNNNIKYLGKKFNLSYALVKAEQKSTLTKDEITNIQFQEFIRYVGDSDNMLNDPPEEHWSEMYRLCSPCYIQYDFIGKLETITEDSKFILSHIGAKIFRV